MAKFVDVYYSALPRLDVEIEKIEHAERRAELKRMKNERVVREKYFAWRLLEFALSKRLGKTPSEVGLFCDGAGKWRSPCVYLSISHSAGAVAVAISDAPVGVDIETEVRTRAENFAERVLNERELRELYALPEGERGWELVRLWSAKEAIFKAGEKEKGQGFQKVCCRQGS